MCLDKNRLHSVKLTYSCEVCGFVTEPPNAMMNCCVSQAHKEAVASRVQREGADAIMKRLWK